MSNTVSITVFGSFADPRTRNTARDIDVAYWGCDLARAQAEVIRWTGKLIPAGHPRPPINYRRIDPAIDVIQAVEDSDPTICLRGAPYKRKVNKWSLPRAIRYVARHNEWPRDSGEFVVSLKPTGDSYTGDGLDALVAAMRKLPDNVRNNLCGHPLFGEGVFFGEGAFDFIERTAPQGSPRLWYFPLTGSIHTDYQGGDVFPLGWWRGTKVFLGANNTTPGPLFIANPEADDEPLPTTSLSEESIMPTPAPAPAPSVVEATPSPLAILGSTMGEGAKDGASMAIAKTMVVAFMATSIGRKMPGIMRTDFAGEILAYVLPILTYLAASYMPSMVPHHETVKAVSLRAIRGYTAVFVSEIMGQLRSFFMEIAFQDLAEKKDA